MFFRSKNTEREEIDPCLNGANYEPTTKASNNSTKNSLPDSTVNEGLDINEKPITIISPPCHKEPKGTNGIEPNQRKSSSRFSVQSVGENVSSNNYNSDSTSSEQFSLRLSRPETTQITKPGMVLQKIPEDVTFA